MMHQNHYKKIGIFLAVFLCFANGCSTGSLESVPRNDIASSSVKLEHGSRNAKNVALTFDADMTPKMKKDLEIGVVKSWDNRSVTDFLESQKVPATLFISGMWAEMYPDEVKRLAANSLFEIGNHSYDHAAFHLPCYGLGEALDKNMEIVKTQGILSSLIGYTPKYFRFPGGCGDSNDIAFASRLGVQVVGWDDVSGDAYIRDDVSKIVTQTIKNVQPGSIIVMHMHGGRTAPLTGNALPEIVKQLREKGYAFLTMSELIKQNPPF